MNKKTVKKIRLAARTADAVKYVPPVRAYGEHGRKTIPSQKNIERWLKRAYNRGQLSLKDLNRMAESEKKRIEV